MKTTIYSIIAILGMTLLPLGIYLLMAESVFCFLAFLGCFVLLMTGLINGCKPEPKKPL